MATFLLTVQVWWKAKKCVCVCEGGGEVLASLAPLAPLAPWLSSLHQFTSSLSPSLPPGSLAFRVLLASPLSPISTGTRLRMQRKEGKKGGLSKKESLLSEDLSRESKVSSSQVSIQGLRKV